MPLGPAQHLPNHTLSHCRPSPLPLQSWHGGNAYTDRVKQVVVQGREAPPTEDMLLPPSAAVGLRPGLAALLACGLAVSASVLLADRLW